jgi:hypothetical protein
MNTYKTKLLNKIFNRNAKILFFGFNENSYKLSLRFIKNGFPTYFYADSTIDRKDEIISNSVVITNLFFDIYDTDIIFLSNTNEMISHIKNYIIPLQYIEIMKHIYHNGILILVDNSISSKTVKDEIKKRIEMTLPYIDPAAPIVESMIDGTNYFYCRYNPEKIMHKIGDLFVDNENSLNCALALFDRI